MKLRTISVFVLALSLAGGAAWLANRWIQMQVQPASAKDDPTTYIVVAAQTIPMGQKIVDTHLESAGWPADRVPGEAFRDMDEIKGQVAAQTIYQGEPILKKKIAEHMSGSTLSALITRNKRAVTVRVNDVVGVAGFVLPGNTVDVLATDESSRNNATAKTVLQNIKVLAVDQTTGSKDEPTVVRAVTLELTPEEAEELVEARTAGEIQLALRNSLDVEVVSQAPEPEPKATPRPTIRRITIIRGTAVSEIRQP